MAIRKIAATFAANSFFGQGEANLFTRASREMLATFATDKPTVFAGSGRLKPEHKSDGTHDLLSIYRGVGWYEKTGPGVYAVIHATNLVIARLGTGRFEVTSTPTFQTDNWGLDVVAHQFVPGWPSTMVNPAFAAEVKEDPTDPTYGAYAHSATIRHFECYAAAWGSGSNTLVRVDPDLIFVGTIGDLA